MKKTGKKFSISILSVLATAFLVGGLAYEPNVKASAEGETAVASSLVMKNGASVRINKTESYEDNGIRFSANISNEDYAIAIQMNNVAFGMFIMPENYIDRFGDLTAENVNQGGVYDWKENRSSEYFYGGSEIQAESHRIIAITYSELPDDVNNEGYKVIDGSVVSIKDDNLELDYVARAFVRYEVDGFYFYEMADWSEDYYANNVRSVTEVTWKALKDADSALTGDEKTALANSYTTNSLTLQGYAPIASASEFASMSASGKYYLAGDITVTSAYASEFTGKLNGNGKTVTLDGASLFSSFAGTLENVNVNASAAVIASMNGGLVDGITVNYAYSESAPYAIAANSECDAQVNNSIVYTDNTNTKYVSGKAFVSNCVKTNDSTAEYKQVTYASDNSEITKLIKVGDLADNKYVYGAASAIAGKVTAWNKEIGTVTEDTLYYAVETQATYDESAEWIQVADSAIGGTQVTATAPYGYENVYANDSLSWATTDISNYAQIRFAVKVSGYFLLDNWSIYADSNDWMNVLAEKQTDGTWTVTVSGPVYSGGWLDSYSESNITKSTLSGLMSFVTDNLDTAYATEVYGVLIPIYGTEIVAQAVVGSTETTEKSAPIDFTKVYSYASVPVGAAFAETDISGYSEVKFYMILASGYVAIQGWGAYAENAYLGTDWVSVVLVNNNDGTWSVTVNAKLTGSSVTDTTKYTYTASGTKLSEVLATWFDFVGDANVYLTEVRGIATEGSNEEEKATVWGKVIESCVLVSDVTLDTTAVAPDGFEAVYAVSGTFDEDKKSTTDLSAYNEVRFAFKSNSYFLMDAWSIYMQESYTDWATVSMVNNGNNSWTVTVYGNVYDGAISNPYTFNYTGNNIQTILADWYNGSNIYVTEMRADLEAETWGERIVDSALTGTTKAIEPVPTGYENVYSKTGFAKGDFADVNISEYSEVRFQLNATSWILFGGWATYYDVHNTWISWTLTKTDLGLWNVRIDATLNTGATYYEETVSAITLKDILNKYYSDNAAITIKCTELRAIKDETPLWGEKIVNSPLKDTTESTELAPANFEKVYTKTAFSTDFANVDISLYSEVRFAIKSSSWVLFNNSWATYYDHRNWVPVVLTNNNDGTWTLEWYAQAQNTNGEASASYPWTETVSGTYLKELISKHSSSTDATVYVTELRGVKKDLPTVEIPDAPAEPVAEPVALEAQADTVLWGEQVAVNGMVGFSEASGVTVPNGYATVSTGIPATTADSNGNRVGELFDTIDISAYTEVRFAFKSSSWMLLNGWANYVHEPNEWVSVSMEQTATNVWNVTVYAQDVVTEADPYTATYTGSTLQEVLINWYNASGETFYVTDIRGETKLWGETIADSAAAAGTVNTEKSAPMGYGAANTIENFADSSAFSTADISAYKEVKFYFNLPEQSCNYFLVAGWGAYFERANNTGSDWFPVTLVNQGSNTWEITVDAYMTGANIQPYVYTKTGASLSEILGWAKGTDGQTLEVSGMRGLKNEAEGVKISNLALTTVYETTEEAVPAGYENVYQKDGLAQGDFANVDISSYSEVNFQVKANGWILFNGWSSYVDTRNTWLPVSLVNDGNNNWAVSVNGNEVDTYSGTTLNAVLASWYSDFEGFQMYVTDLRGVHGTYEANQIKAIAMLQSDKTSNSEAAALELSALIKEITGTELLVEYYEDASGLDSNRRYILLGSWAESSVDTAKLVTETGYIMKKVGNNVALYATTERGIYEAVYGFLSTYYGLEFYTDTVKTYTLEGNPLIGAVDEVVFNPSIEYAWAIDGLITRGEGDDYNWDYVNRLGYSNLHGMIGGGGWHNFTEVISEEKYGASGTVSQNASWFVTKTDASDVSYVTLDIANYGDAIAQAVANEFAAMINANPNLDVWQLTPPDHEDTSFTSDVYVAFMNKVAAALNGQILRKVNLMLLAYTSTFEAPTTAFVKQDNVGFSVMVAPIRMNYYYGFDNDTFTGSNGMTNAWYLTQIQAWSEMADELYVWNYSTYFDNYFVPLDTITNMQSKYQAYANAGAKGMYDQGTGEAKTTDWVELKAYLKAELTKNVNADVDALVENFMKAYYGEAAAPYMLQLLKAQQAHYATIAANMEGGHVTRDSLFNKEYWGGSTNATLTTWYGYIQSALDATTDATLKARIHKEGLTVRYLHQVLYNYTIIGDSSYTLTVTTVDGTSMTDTLEQIITDAKALGIERFAEGTGWICNDGNIWGTDNLVDGVIDNLA